eukprot:SAG11_NODE_36670_length_260_cov_0.968944_1_plen_64_part_01
MINRMCGCGAVDDKAGVEMVRKHTTRMVWRGTSSINSRTQWSLTKFKDKGLTAAALQSPLARSR